MKIALFSDIHANLPALKAFFKSIEKERPDMIYCLGDLVGFNIWPNEVINEIKKRRIPALAGNHDFNLSRENKNSNPYNKEAMEISDFSNVYTHSILGDEERHYLGTLPLHIYLEFQLKQVQINLLLVHGSATSIDELLFENCNEQYLLSMMQKANAHIMCFGHTHQPFHKVLKEKKVGCIYERHAVNIGSVGKPKDGDPRGCYVMLNLTESQTDCLHFKVEVNFIRFFYNVEKAAKAIESSPLPPICADMLRKAY